MFDSSSFDSTSVVAWVILAAAVVTALGVLYRQAVVPVTDGITRLLEILGEDEYGRNLRDRVDSIERTLEQDTKDATHRDILNQMKTRDARMDTMEDSIQEMTKRLLPMVEAISILARRQTKRPAAKTPAKKPTERTS